jgi:hypothetical protein
MPKKFASRKVIRKSSKDIPPASKADLAQLRAAMDEKIDTSDNAERRKLERWQRGPGCAELGEAQASVQHMRPHPRHQDDIHQ